MTNNVRTGLVILVALVWAINFTAPVFVEGFKPVPELNVAFMAIVGVLVASYNKDAEAAEKAKKQLEKVKDDEKEDEDAS